MDKQQEHYSKSKMSDIKRVYMACFKGGPCIEVKNGRIRLKKLHTPREQKGNLLPSNRPPLHQRIIKNP